MRKVVIIGQGYTGRLSIVRSVAELGCDITLIALLPHHFFQKAERKPKQLDSFSKYVSRTIYSENYNETMLVDILKNECVDPTQKTFVFPDNDFSAAAIDNHRNELKDHFFIPHIQDRQGAVEEWMDKIRQKEAARTVGLKVADAIVIDVKDRHFQIPDTVTYPCFAKPLVSIVGGKSGLAKCSSKEDLKKHLEFLLTLRDDIRVLVEDFKEIDREFATLGFSDGGAVFIPGVLELLHVGHGSHFGVALQGRIFPADGFEALIEKFKELVRMIGFVGIFDVDFYESKGEFYFCELNLRFGGSGYAFTKMGVNLPAMMIKYFEGESLDACDSVVRGSARYFNERMAVDDWYGGYLSTNDYYRLRDESKIKFVADDEDPKPQKVLDREFRIKWLKKTIKGWIRKS